MSFINVYTIYVYTFNLKRLKSDNLLILDCKHLLIVIVSKMSIHLLSIH